MKDRKQKYHSENRDPVLMEVIQDWMREEEISSYALHDRIAPLMREKFPAKEHQEIISDAWCRGHNYVSAPSRKIQIWEDTSDLLEKAKHLWEGQAAKGTCPWCGGSGRIPYNVKYPEAAKGSHVKHMASCPHCGGTGECKHKGFPGWLGAFKGLGPPMCLDCGEEAERRSGEERRDPLTRSFQQVHKRYPFAKLRRSGAERRVNKHAYETLINALDRRTLPDRRKAHRVGQGGNV